MLLRVLTGHCVFGSSVWVRAVKYSSWRHRCPLRWAPREAWDRQRNNDCLRLTYVCYMILLVYGERNWITWPSSTPDNNHSIKDNLELTYIIRTRIKGRIKTIRTVTLYVLFVVLLTSQHWDSQSQPVLPHPSKDIRTSLGWFQNCGLWTKASCHLHPQWTSSCHVKVWLHLKHK